MSDTPVFAGRLKKFSGKLSTVSLSETALACVCCGGQCHELLRVPRDQIGRGMGHDYLVLRCMDCRFKGPYVVFFQNGIATRVSPRGGYEAEGFIAENCDADSMASIQWTEVASQGSIAAV